MSTLPDWMIAAISLVIPGFSEPAIIEYNGYAEGRYVYVAAAQTGRIVEISAVEGGSVALGDILFRIDDTHQIVALRAAEAQLAVAKANLENLATGSRAAEIDVIRASLEQAKADQRLAETTLQRSLQLLVGGSIAQARVDADNSRLQSANAKVAQLQAQLQVAELPARSAQRIAAEASLDAAAALRDDASSALDDRKVEAPIGGAVDRIFFEQGEVAGAGVPVVAVLPPDSLTAVFFIPEGDRSNVSLNQMFAVTCSDCPETITARLTQLASTPQYTPPIIYSRDERSRLVFRAEAEIDNAGGLLPGQPISLRPIQ